MTRVFAAVLVFLFIQPENPVFAGEEKLEAADVVPYLLGHWRFELGERTGGRIYTPLFGDNSAQVEEYFDEAAYIGKGLIQYSADDGRFSSALYFNVGVSDFVMGTFDEEGQSIIYRSVKEGSENLEMVFHIIGPDHFEYNTYQIDKGAHERILHADFYRVK